MTLNGVVCVLLIFTALQTMQGCISHEFSVRMSVCQNAWIVIKRKKLLLPKFLYRIKSPFIYFSDRKNGWWGRPLLPEILGQTVPVALDIRS